MDKTKLKMKGDYKEIRRQFFACVFAVGVLSLFSCLIVAKVLAAPVTSTDRDIFSPPRNRQSRVLTVPEFEKITTTQILSSSSSAATTSSSTAVGTTVVPDEQVQWREPAPYSPPVRSDLADTGIGQDDSFWNLLNILPYFFILLGAIGFAWAIHEQRRKHNELWSQLPARIQEKTLRPVKPAVRFSTVPNVPNMKGPLVGDLVRKNPSAKMPAVKSPVMIKVRAGVNKPGLKKGRLATAAKKK